ncbi:TPA: helix-turn-helix domain-containing protein, partial [Enterococcus faecalis]|nr:helix-turn-helix domain-containing protein [Enterococcus faecalis]
MNFNVFLDEDQRYKYYIVKLLELKQNTFFSQAQLMEALGVSKYKIDRFLKDIEEDSELLNLQISIVVDTSGEIRAQGFNNLVTKKLRLYYLEQSKQYQLLYEMLVGSNQSAESLATKLYVSRASIYNELKILKDNLKIYGLKVKNLKIVGRELKVRSFFFSLFNDFYCGITKPFSQKLNKRINSFKNLLLVNKNIYPTKVQEYRLELFIGISFIRKEKNFFLDESVLDVPELDLYPYFKLYGSSKNKSNLDIQNEIQNIFFFCYTENLINDLQWKINFKDNKEALDISENFVKELEKVVILDIKIKEQIRKEIFRINQKWLYFHFKEATFVFENQKSYFQEIYFKCDSIVRTYLGQSSLEKLFEDKEEKVKVYYDYLFLLTTIVPANFIEEVIYVCVDFSHGKFYNDFIQNSIRSFKNLNIVFEHKITNETQIY